MRVISNRALVIFATEHPGAGEPLQAWRKAMETRNFSHYAELKATFGSVDKAGGFHVFDIGGNKWRIVALLNFGKQLCFIRHVFTHKEYDQWAP
ncbi:MAG: type II toxin-antitoxin system HigB family toxin [Pseudomonadales bacterium]|jgi:mRNA interferase HigB|nr:type II toxin-antitoxin system HigB family toxin [Pseudomonadales bacterium]